MIVAIIREAVCGTRVPNFETRVGYNPGDVGAVATELSDILNGLGIHE